MGMVRAKAGLEAAPFEPFERDEAFQDLARLMAGNRPPIALVGAGASVRSGYVSWKGLVDEMEKAAGAEAAGVRWKSALAEFNDAPWTAEVHRKAMGEAEFANLIATQFGPKAALAEPHLTLGEMGFRHFLTTNYDPCIEEALNRAGHPVRVVRWSDHDELSRFLINLGEPTKEKAVVYLHGRYDRPAEAVLTESSYVERYITSDDARRKLLAIFMTHPVVFVGFSMNDPDFANLMREVTARLRARPPAHFALLGYSSIEEREAYAARMTDKFGVRPIFFSRISEPGGDEFANLIHLLDALASREARSVAEVAPKPSLQGAPGAVAPVDPKDPQKGQWGGTAEANGRLLRAEATGLKGRWLNFELIVESTTDRPLAGEVVFHLHPSFQKPVRVVQAAAGKATLSLTSYGAFAVGALADEGQTRLELDLALQSDLPLDWRQR